jgi:hypothetical protein
LDEDVRGRVCGASALLTIICVLCTLHARNSRSTCNFTHYSNS